MPGPPARYLPDLDRVEILSACRQPLRALLVHEFLHAIRERARRLSGEALSGYDPEGEEWVRERSLAPCGGSASCAPTPSAARTSAPSARPSTSLR